MTTKKNPPTGGNPVRGDDGAGSGLSSLSIVAQSGPDCQATPEQEIDACYDLLEDGALVTWVKQSTAGEPITPGDRRRLQEIVRRDTRLLLTRAADANRRGSRVLHSLYTSAAATIASFAADLWQVPIEELLGGRDG